MRSLVRIFAFVVLPVLAARPLAAEKLDPPPPRSPAESLHSLHVRKGFKVELVAAEPLVFDPVAIEWGPDGKLWVVEMADYPLGVDGKMKPGGSIRVLEDTDGDGRYDRSTAFLQGVNFPNGIMPWGKGVLVTAAPEIFYAEDTDGDGRADVRRTLYKGFVEGNPQLRVNGLQWGLDGWIYCANGWSGGVVHSEKTGATVDIGGRDLRIRPDQGLIDTVAGVSEFGRNRDDWGRWFGCDNSNPLWHFVLEDYYTRRNPHIAPPEVKQQLMVPLNPKVYPRAKLPKRYHTFDQSGRFTSACGGMIYRDNLLFGDTPDAHAFVCEPVHNLVHHEVVREDGVSFTAGRPDEERESEFLASEDSWFRPVMVRTGPDGALWVVDMYRYMIEHPEWLPPEGKAELEPFFRWGDDRGRIYRIYPEGKPPRPIPRLDQLNSEKLAAALDTPNGWQRDMAQQLLVSRADENAVAPLTAQLEGANPLARIQALTTLDLMGKLDMRRLAARSADEHPAVKCQVLRIAESQPTDDKLWRALGMLVGNGSPKVQLQLACSLGAWKNDESGTLLGRIAVANLKSPYIQAAVLSSIRDTNLDEIVEVVVGSDKAATRFDLAAELWREAALFHRDDLVVKLTHLIALAPDTKYTPQQLAALSGVLAALERRGARLEEIIKPLAAPGSEALARVQAAVEHARAAVGDVVAPEELRIAAVTLLGYEPPRLADDIEALGSVLVPQTPTAIQRAAVAQLGRQKDASVAPALLAGWGSYPPALRSQTLAVLVSRPAWLAALLDALEKRDVLPADIDATTRQQLIAHKDEGLRKRAASLLATSADADREKVLAAHQDVAQFKGDPGRGETVFKRKCSVCHKVGTDGFEVGPNLASLNDKSVGNILASILDPSRAVESRYRGYIAQTAEGQTFSGVLAAETGNSITLLAQEGKQQVILRTDLEELRSTGKSLMPDGLEKDLSKQDLADIIKFVATLKNDGAAPQ